MALTLADQRSRTQGTVESRHQSDSTQQSREFVHLSKLHKSIAADEGLSKAVAGIAKIIVVPGDDQRRSEHVRTVIRQTGIAMMGPAERAGDDCAAKAAAEAIACPVLDGSIPRAARGVPVNTAASEETLKLSETKLVMNTVCARLTTTRSLSSTRCTTGRWVTPCGRR